MAKIEVKNATAVARKLTTELRKTYTKELRDKKNRQVVGDIVVNVKGGIKDVKLGKANAVTQAYRKYYEKFNKTDSKYKREEITANFTGELLKDLASNVKAKTTQNKFEYVIEQSNKKHKLYKRSKKAKGKRLAVTYSFISDRLIELGYNYLVFTKQSKTAVSKFIKKKLVDALKGKLGK